MEIDKYEYIICPSCKFYGDKNNRMRCTYCIKGTEFIKGEPLDGLSLMKKALEKWGKDSQIMITIEECGELIQVLAKRNRSINGSTEDEICREIADVQTMCLQMRLIFNADKIDNYMDLNMARLKNLFEDKYEYNTSSKTH